MKEIIESNLTLTKKNMQDIIERFENEIIKIRTGRADIKILDNVLVNNYGVLTPLNQTAQLSAPSAMQLMIKPYNIELKKNIVAGLNKSHHEFNIQDHGSIIYINIAPLTEEVRLKLVKEVNFVTENFKIHIRNERRNFLHHVKTEVELSKEMLLYANEMIQSVTDDAIKQIQNISKSKNKLLMKV